METAREKIPDQQIAELTLITTISRVANAAIQTDDFLPEVAAELAKTHLWDRVVIGLRQLEDIIHVVVDQPGSSDLLLGGQYATPTDFALILEVLNSGQTSVLHTADPELENTPIKTALEESGLQSVLCILLHDQENLLGALIVGSTTPREVAPNEVHFFEKLCDVITTAIVRIYKYEELQLANRLKSSFLATVTHELRTPVTSIVGYAQMLERGKFGELSEIMQEAISYVLYSGNKMLSLVNDLLDFSRLEAGRLNVDLTNVDLEKTVRTVVGVMRPQVQERKLGLVTEIEPDLPLVRASAERLEQVLMNLLSNAVKFTEEGAITVGVKHLDDQHVRISVQDTGIGLTPEHQALIFEEYVQIKNQQTLRFAGTGLGLAISRRLVEIMGGSMSLESEFNVGSTFHCDLRIVHQAQHELQRGTGDDRP